MARKGTISKDRVKKNGEVFTPDEIVNDMLDLLDNSMANRLGVGDSNSMSKKHGTAPINGRKNGIIVVIPTITEINTA